MSSYLPIALASGGSFTIIEPGEYSVFTVVGLDVEHGALYPLCLVFIGLSIFFGSYCFDVLAKEVRLWRFGRQDLADR